MSRYGIAADPSKLEAIRQFPTPDHLKTLRSFLGLASYYRRFIPTFSKVASPLFALTRTGVPFEWTDQCRETFEQLKKLLTESPVLAFPDFEKQFLLETDASIKGLGAVLAKKQEDNSVRPVAYASRTLHPSRERATKSPLTPIPVGGAFDRVGVDVLQFATSSHGNKYAVVFMDYLTKWPEVFAVPDQTAHTIAQLLVEHVISRHGVPAQLLSDRGPNFLSGLLKETCELMGIHRLNTTSYHPQTDGLVERFNRTLTSMLAKTVEKSGANWDEKLLYVLFAYRVSVQESTKESPFFLMYGRDPRLPTDCPLCAHGACKCGLGGVW